MFTQKSTKKLAGDCRLSALAKLCASLFIIFYALLPAEVPADMGIASNNVSGFVQPVSGRDVLDQKEIQKRLQSLDNAFAAQNRQIHQVRLELQSIQDENHWLKMALLGMSIMLAASGYFFADWLKRKTVQQALPDKPLSMKTAVEVKPRYPLNTSNTASPAATDIAASEQAEPLASELIQKHANATASEKDTATALRSQVLQKQASPPTHTLAANALSNATLTRLKNHLTQSPKQSARIWLYLLDKLKSEGLQADYDCTANNCKIHFNLQTEAFLTLNQATTEPATLESFPRLINTLNACWGTPAALSFLDDLIYNTRPMPRIGFNRYVFEELLMLRDIAALTQDIPRNRNKSTTIKKRDDLNLLSQIEQDISGISASMMNEFQYWSTFSFVLDEPPNRRKLA